MHKVPSFRVFHGFSCKTWVVLLHPRRIIKRLRLPTLMNNWTSRCINRQQLLCHSTMNFYDCNCSSREEIATFRWLITQSKQMNFLRKRKLVSKVIKCTLSKTFLYVPISVILFFGEKYCMEMLFLDLFGNQLLQKKLKHFTQFCGQF